MTEAWSSPLPDELLALKKFHGHLGPYVVIGYRMGTAARERYPGRIFAIVFCGSKRPISCIADGVQFSSCCTLGKSNIKVVEDGQSVAIFTDGVTAVQIVVPADIVESYDRQMTQVDEGTLALSIFEMKEDDLLTISDTAVPF
ncbi:MAG: formylmethanofuran dehydrogenase subunit E family protein [Methanomassiliicoccales archaeon]|nr:formylmethanofuran dehydrogenase subunit E family protein [Methanomassiliicoccales archaeon]